PPRALARGGFFLRPGAGNDAAYPENPVPIDQISPVYGGLFWCGIMNFAGFKNSSCKTGEIGIYYSVGSKRRESRAGV
ncbi:hypothetical protein, partial [uncultured Anaerotruncus sp.]|uniref:hypothetical protein n=1 Tax=uncultured Anaerotruncus sp. TaxID=905011 RepID=UPI00321F84A3